MLLAGIVLATTVAAQQASPPTTRPARQSRPAPPTRDPNSPGFVKATELPDGAVPPADADGNFIIGTTHKRAPEMSADPGVPKGTIHNFTMKSSDSKLYPGVARERNGAADPSDPAKMIVEQPPRSLHAASRGLRPQPIRSRNRRPVHRRRRRTGWTAVCRSG